MKVSVKYSDLKNTCNNITKKTDELAIQIDALGKTLEELSSVWQGMDGVTFYNNAIGCVNQAKQIPNIYKALVNKIANLNDKYEEIDERRNFVYEPTVQDTAQISGELHVDTYEDIYPNRPIDNKVAVSTSDNPYIDNQVGVSSSDSQYVNNQAGGQLHVDTYEDIYPNRPIDNKVAVSSSDNPYIDNQVGVSSPDSQYANNQSGGQLHVDTYEDIYGAKNSYLGDKKDHVTQLAVYSRVGDKMVQTGVINNRYVENKSNTIKDIEAQTNIRMNDNGKDYVIGNINPNNKGGA